MEYSINLVAKMTGLSQHAIRAWERRYGAVKPGRSEGRHRLYSDADVERLNLLRRATEAGHGISKLAALSTEQLRPLVGAADDTATPVSSELGKTRSGAILAFTREGLEAIRALNTAGLESMLDRAALGLGHQGLLQQVIAPLVQAVGEQWKQGVITAAHEHFASALVRGFLANTAKPFAGNGSGPNLVVATPAGQLHELGAVLVGAAAGNDGWHVTYLGVSLPAAEIAGAALQNNARAVALSIVYPEDDPNLPEQLRKLRQYLPPETAILVGGRAAPGYREVLTQIQARQCTHLEELYQCLTDLRRPQQSGRRTSSHTN